MNWLYWLSPIVENSSTVPKLNDAMREMCESQLTVSEIMFSGSLDFPKQQSSGNNENGISQQSFIKFLARNSLLTGRIVKLLLHSW